MGGKCFIINECNFKDEVIKEIKEILLENDYSPIVAEEIVSFNVLLFDHKILRWMLDADFVIALLSPKDKDSKTANFNVAFEFGYSRGKEKNVILLFDEKLEKLPTDVRGHFGISLQDVKWKEKLKVLIQEQKTIKDKRRPPLPKILETHLESGIVDSNYDIFAQLLRDICTSFSILSNESAFKNILRIFEEPKFQIDSGGAINRLLDSLNVIFSYDMTQNSESMKTQLIKYLPKISEESNNIDILRQVLTLIAKINHDSSVVAIKNFIIKRKPEITNNVFNGFGLDFSQMELKYLNELLKDLSIFKVKPNDYGIEQSKLNVIDIIWQNVLNTIKTKAS